MTYGQTLRSIRLDKGMTQKEIYSGVVSRTFYGRFEKGEQQMTAEKFAALLANIGIDFNEFSYIHQNYQQPTNQSLRQQIDTYYAKQDFAHLLALYNKNKASADQQTRFLASYAYALTYGWQNNGLQLDNAPIQPLVQYLRQLKHWTIADLEIFAMGILGMTEDWTILTACYTEAQQTYRRYRNYSRWYDVALPFSSILSSYTQLILDSNHHGHELANLRQTAVEMLVEPHSAQATAIRLTLKMTIALIDMYTGDRNSATNQLKAISNTATMLELPNAALIATLYRYRAAQSQLVNP